MNRGSYTAALKAFTRGVEVCISLKQQTETSCQIVLKQFEQVYLQVWDYKKVKYSYFYVHKETNK